MRDRVMYVELKTGFFHDGPAWIGRVRLSKTGRMLYYRGRRLQSLKGGGALIANYIDIDTGEQFWVSGVKRNGQDRHWAGHGPVQVDEDAADEYRELLGL